MEAIQRNIPQLRFPEFNGEWLDKTLGDYYKSLRTGMTPYRGRPEFYKGNIPWISSGELNYNTITKTNETITDNAVKETNLRLYPKGTFFIAITGLEAPGTRGKCAINGVPATTNQSCMAFEQIDEIDTLYLFYWYNKYGVPLYYRFAQGTKQQSFNNKIVEKFQFIAPTLPEQQKIANFLTVVDSKLQTLKKKKELLAQYKKGVMQKIFSQELRFKPALSEVEGNDEGNNFADWEVKNGNDVFDSVSDKNHNSDLPILAITQDYGAIPRDMIDYQMTVSEKSVASYKVVQVGDFIISLRSFQGGIEYSDYKGICSPAYIILRPKITIDRTFFKYYLKTKSYIKELNRKLEGIRDGKMVSYKYFSEIKLPYPCIEEQTKIANFLSAIDDKITSCELLIANAEKYKKGLLQQMFV